jgi:soluble lytic murein transglycosylase
LACSAYVLCFRLLGHAFASPSKLLKISIVASFALLSDVTGRRGILVVSGLLVAACGLAGAHAVRPAGSSLRSHESAVQAPQTKIERDRGSGKKSLDLTNFRPLLLEPSLSKVRNLAEEERFAEAAQELESSSADESGDGLATLRRHFLIGSLYGAAAKKDLAAKHYKLASAADWVLKDDAVVRLAELEIEQQKAEEALATLALVAKDFEIRRVLLIRGKALQILKKPEEALVAYRTLPDSAEERDARLGIARALLDLANSSKDEGRRRERATEALHAAELARLGLSADESVAVEAAALIQRARSLGAAPESLSLELKLAHLDGLVESQDFEAAEVAAQSITAPLKPTFSAEWCRFDYLRGKLLSGNGEWGAAADRITSSAENCKNDPKLHAALLFNAGKYSAADGRNLKAVKFYEELEARHPRDSLADDARLRAAKSYQEAGMTARFVELLSKMPEDYPDGDMTMEGVLLLSLYLIERDDWSTASGVLERAATNVRASDSARGHEYSGTERYFLARCLQKLGQEEEALIEYESIVVDVPLSYYMLHAYSRLLDADPKRAQAALDKGLSRAKNTPFEFPHRPEFDTPQFARGMELLLVGETDEGAAVLSDLGMGEGADDSLLWGIALLHDRAGDAHTAHQIARGRLSDWLSHYPAGDWQNPWEIGFPRPYHSIVQKESLATGVPEWFIYGVMREESTFRPRVVSHADAYGLMQVIPPTARSIGKAAGLPYSPAALKTPAVNIAIGSRVLEGLARRFKTNPWLAIPGYNAGPGRPARWLRERPNVDFDVWVEMIPFRETRRYTKRVLASRAAYAFLYQRQEAQTALVLPKRLTVN